VRDLLPGPLVLALSALVTAGAILRFYGLGHQGFWFDEANTALLVKFSPGNMLGLLPQSESTPPLYYCVAWVWSHIFGDNEAGLRSLSALCGVLVIPVAYGIGSTLSTRRVGLVAAALVAFNPFLIWYSQEARAYEMLVLLAALSLLALARVAIASPERDGESATGGDLVLWALFGTLALLTHYYAIVVLIPMAAWLLVTRGRERAVRIAVTAVMACGVVLVPLALSQNSTGHDSWIGNTPLGLRLTQITPQLLIGTGSPDRWLVKWLAYAAALIGLALLAWGAQRAERRTALLMGGLALSGFLLELILVAIGIDDLITRNLIALVVPLGVALAAGLGARRAGPAGLAVAAVLCGLGLTATIGIAADRNLQRPDWRYVARALGTHPPPGSPGRAILIQHYLDLLPLSLYLPHLKHMRPAGAVVDQLDVISIRSPQQPLCWWGAACNLIPSQMQRSYTLPGFHVVWRRRVLQFTILHMVARHPQLLTPPEVAAVLHTTRLHRDDLLVQR
jgi:mannosyltransferase